VSSCGGDPTSCLNHPDKCPHNCSTKSDRQKGLQAQKHDRKAVKTLGNSCRQPELPHQSEHHAELPNPKKANTTQNNPTLSQLCDTNRESGADMCTDTHPTLQMKGRDEKTKTPRTKEPNKAQNRPISLQHDPQNPKNRPNLAPYRQSRTESLLPNMQ
jgi:hypothetical protein